MFIFGILLFCLQFAHGNFKIKDEDGFLDFFEDDDDSGYLFDYYLFPAKEKKRTAQDLLEEVDKDGSDSISVEEFITLKDFKKPDGPLFEEEAGRKQGRDAFRAADEDEDGELTAEELQKRMDQIRENDIGAEEGHEWFSTGFSKHEAKDAQKLLNKADKDGTDSLNLEEFLTLAEFEDVTLGRKAFEHVDKDHNEVVTVDELKESLEKKQEVEPLSGLDLSAYYFAGKNSTDAQDMINQADQDGSGSLNVGEFLKLAKFDYASEGKAIFEWADKDKSGDVSLNEWGERLDEVYKESFWFEDDDMDFGEADGFQPGQIFEVGEGGQLFHVSPASGLVAAPGLLLLLAVAILL